MKSKLLILCFIILVGCKKDDLFITPVSSIKQNEAKIESLKSLSYKGKTSYELRKAQKYVDIDSIRKVLGVYNEGRWEGSNNLGWVYVDMNNDGREDIFYPLMSESKYNKRRPLVFINTPNGYKLDNSMIPSDYEGELDTRKSVVCDFNNDGYPDIFSSNAGFDADTQIHIAKPALILSDGSGKFIMKKLNDEILNGGGFHGAAGGDINSDGNADLVLVGWGKVRVLYGKGDGTFTHNYINIDDDRAFLTCEIVDVDKNGRNDIILAGNEMWTKSRVIWDGNFNDVSYISDYQQKWGTIMDIVCEDLDNDGVNEIILNRTGDENGLWYCGYYLTTYKREGKQFLDITNKFFTLAKEQFFLQNGVPAGGWIPHIVVDKDSDGRIVLYGDRKNYDKFYKIWVQSKETMRFN